MSSINYSQTLPTTSISSKIKGQEKKLYPMGILPLLKNENDMLVYTYSVLASQKLQGN